MVSMRPCSCSCSRSPSPNSCHPRDAGELPPSQAPLSGRPPSPSPNSCHPSDAGDLPPSQAPLSGRPPSPSPNSCHPRDAGDLPPSQAPLSGFRWLLVLLQFVGTTQPRTSLSPLSLSLHEMPTAASPKRGSKMPGRPLRAGAQSAAMDP